MTYQTSVPTVKDAYPSSGYGDDLSMAALWLGLAQNDSTLIGQAKGYYNQFQLGNQLPESAFNWDSVLPGIPILGTQIFQSYPQLGGDNWQPQAETYLDRLVAGKGGGKLTKGTDLPCYYDKVLTELFRRVALLQRNIRFGELEPGDQRGHVIEEICYDCDNRS